MCTLYSMILFVEQSLRRFLVRVLNRSNVLVCNISFVHELKTLDPGVNLKNCQIYLQPSKQVTCGGSKFSFREQGI